MQPEQTNLPAQIADALVSIPKGLTPAMVKALDRLIGAAVDIPVAWLQQKKAKIDAQTESYKLVEASIAQAVAAGAGGNPDIAQRAMDILVRKEYRKQTNREGVAAAMIEDMREHATNAPDENIINPATELDEDWLNVFERYAEDASSERLQGLWGRVLAGEIRRPGRFSTRTLRFLSEFSQADALSFEAFTKFSFGDIAPTKLVKPDTREDIRELIYLESSGLIDGAGGTGFKYTMTFNSDGYCLLCEESLCLALKGNANTSFSHEVIALTPLGQELLNLVASRNARESARNVAFALQCAEIKECHIGVIVNSAVRFIENLWNETSASGDSALNSQIPVT